MFGSQLQTVDQNVAAAVLGLKPEQVKIKTLLCGRKLRRRATPAADMAAEAASVLKASKHDGPIKIIWTREEDIKGGRYRPVIVHHVRGGLDDKGEIVAWDQVIVGQSFIKGSPFESAMIKNGVDQTMVEGASTLPYQVPNLQRFEPHPRGGRLDAVVALGGLYAHGLLDRDVPRSARRSGRHRCARHPPEASRQASAPSRGFEPCGREGWLGYAAAERQGSAAWLCMNLFKSFVAHVVEVSAGDDGLPKVERVVVAADCGIAINPDVIKAQLEGGMGYGLSAILYGAIDMEDGRIVQSNFNDYRVLRINEMPKVEAYIIEFQGGVHGYRASRSSAHRTCRRQCLGETHRAARLRSARLARSSQGIRREI